MLGKTHLFYGTTAGVLAAVLFVHPERPLGLVEAVLFGAAGGLLPDLDEPGSTISNSPRILGGLARRAMRRATGGTALRLLGVVAGAIVLLIAQLLNAVSRALSWTVRLVSGGHREGTHWLPVGAGLSIAVAAVTVPWLGPTAAIAFAAGYLSHLVGDGCTRSGIPLVPVSGSRLHFLPRLLRVRTGTVGETVANVAYGVVLVAVAYLLWSSRIVTLAL